MKILIIFFLYILMKLNPFFIIMIIGTFFVSCKEDKVEESKNIKPKKDPALQVSISKTENPKDQVRHFFSANGGSILYLKNGEVKGQARFDTDGDFITELLKTKTYGTYSELDNYLIERKHDTVPFFEEFGKIDGSWKILKGIAVENVMQVSSYQSPENPGSGETETITETRLIIFSPETKTFADENSEEAEDYFTAMDDWGFYSHELRENFEQLGIKTIYLKKPYLKLNMENNQKIIINTKHKINNHNVQALLYKKGKRPIIVHLIFSDNDLEEIKEYLK